MTRILLMPIRKNAPASCLLLIVFFSVPQAKSQKLRVGIKAGTAISNCTIKSTEPVITTTSKASVTVGLFAHIRLRRRFSVRTGVEYVSKGALVDKTYTEYYSYTVRGSFRFNYLDLPVNFLYDIPLGPNKLFAGGGPVMSFLLNKNANPGVAGNDVGANILAGFEWPIGAAFIINYTHGFKNISGNRYNETAIRNHYFGITLAYWF